VGRDFDRFPHAYEQVVHSARACKEIDAASRGQRTSHGHAKTLIIYMTQEQEYSVRYRHTSYHIYAYTSVTGFVHADTQKI
jgi:hypothetical protein